jgi:allophanate hydrolase
LDIALLESAYREGTLTPTALVEQIYGDIEKQGERPVWIALVPKEQNLQRAAELEASSSAGALALFGIPFAVKDNFDVKGMPTTAACPAFAHDAVETATAVKRLLDAGAILISSPPGWWGRVRLTESARVFSIRNTSPEDRVQVRRWPWRAGW